MIVNGASHVWGGEPTEHTTNALLAARSLLRPGGRLLLGEGFWERRPSPARIAAMPIPPDQYRSLPDLVDLALDHGYRPLPWSCRRRAWTSGTSSSRGTLWAGNGGCWPTNPDSPHADEVRARADAHRDAWLRGWRGVLGFAYLTLVVA